MAEQHTFRDAFRTGGEQHRGRITWRNAETAVQRSGETQRDCAIELVDDAEFFTDILEPDEVHHTRQTLGESSELGELDKAAGGEDPAQPARPAPPEHPLRPAGRA